MAPHETSFTGGPAREREKAEQHVFVPAGLDLSRMLADFQKTHKNTHIFFPFFPLYFQKPQIMDQVNVTGESTSLLPPRSDLVYMGVFFLPLLLAS